MTNRTNRRKIRTLFKFERKINIVALQDSNSQQISSNCPELGEFAFYCRRICQKVYCFALPITASLLQRRQWAVGGMFSRSAKTETRRALPGNTLYYAGRKSSPPTEEFRPSGVVGPARGIPRININDRLLLRHMDWGWF